MTDEQKREYAEAIKCALGMGGYGPPMEGEEGWVPPVAMLPDALPDEDDGWDVLYGDGGVIGDAVVTDAGELDPEAVRKEVQAGVEAARRELREMQRQERERKLAEERAKASAPKPPEGPWAVVGKREDDGDRIMDITRNFC